MQSSFENRQVHGHIDANTDAPLLIIIGQNVDVCIISISEKNRRVVKRIDIFLGVVLSSKKAISQLLGLGRCVWTLSFTKQDCCRTT